MKKVRTKNFKERLCEVLGEEIANKYRDISNVSESQMIVDAKTIAKRILREDKEFYESMQVLFGGNGR